MITFLKYQAGHFRFQVICLYTYISSLKYRYTVTLSGVRLQFVCPVQIRQFRYHTVQHAVDSAVGFQILRGLQHRISDVNTEQCHLLGIEGRAHVLKTEGRITDAVMPADAQDISGSIIPMGGAFWDEQRFTPAEVFPAYTREVRQINIRGIQDDIGRAITPFGDGAVTEINSCRLTRLVQPAVDREGQRIFLFAHLRCGVHIAGDMINAEHHLLGFLTETSAQLPAVFPPTTAFFISGVMASTGLRI